LITAGGVACNGAGALIRSSGGRWLGSRGTIPVGKGARGRRAAVIPPQVRTIPSGARDLSGPAQAWTFLGLRPTLTPVPSTDVPILGAYGRNRGIRDSDLDTLGLGRQKAHLRGCVGPGDHPRGIQLDGGAERALLAAGAAGPDKFGDHSARSIAACTAGPMASAPSTPTETAAPAVHPDPPRTRRSRWRDSGRPS